MVGHRGIFPLQVMKVMSGVPILNMVTPLHATAATDRLLCYSVSSG